MGRACCICGYSRCANALEFHHLDPAEKDFSFGNARAEPKSWAKIVAEIRKCVMLCANCHREVHDDLATVPEDAPQFNPLYEDYRAVEKSMRVSDCPVCGKPKRLEAGTCSIVCARSRQSNTDWSSYDVLVMRETMTLEQIGRKVGVTGNAVAKRLKKLRAI